MFLIRVRWKLFTDQKLKNILRLFSLLIALGFSIGCGMLPTKPRHSARDLGRTLGGQTYFNKDQTAPTQKMVEAKTGSLWVDGYSSRIYENMHRASRVGDTVMIVIAEESHGKDSGGTSSDKKSENSSSISSLGGIVEKIHKAINLFDPSNLLASKTDTKFQGKASTERKSELFARITGTIIEVLGNGNLVIEAEKRIRVNNEEQILIVEGVIRPYDIQPDNTVLSTSIADARVSYSGFGVVAEKQRPGWLARILDYVWPF